MKKEGTFHKVSIPSPSPCKSILCFMKRSMLLLLLHFVECSKSNGPLSNETGPLGDLSPHSEKMNETFLQGNEIEKVVDGQV